jgi:hypothetical protein
MANGQGDNKSWRSNTSKLDERSFNGVPICPASIKEMTAVGKNQNKEKIRVSQRSK